MERAGYARLDADYLLQVRPHLTDREARVYEALILLCDGWNRPMTVADVASVTRLHVDHVRKAIRVLESIKLIACTWQGARTNPNGERFVTIVRDYAPVLLALRALGRISPESSEALGQNSPESPVKAPGQNGPKTPGRNSPKTLGQNGPKHLTRSDPDPSIPPSQPSLRALVAPKPPSEPDGGREALESTPEVPDELVALCRELWTPGEVPVRAAQRFVARLLVVGNPSASVSEVARYLRTVAKTHRVQTARCPVAVACMPDEFGAWLARARKVVRVEPTPRPPAADAVAPREAGARAAAIIEHLAKCFPDEREVAQPRPGPTTKPPEIVSNARA